MHEVDLNDPTGIPFREEIKPQMVFKLDDIAAVVYVNVDPFFAIAGELELKIVDLTQIHKSNKYQFQASKIICLFFDHIFFFFK